MGDVDLNMLVIVLNINLIVICNVYFVKKLNFYILNLYYIKRKS